MLQRKLRLPIAIMVAVGVITYSALKEKNNPTLIVQEDHPIILSYEINLKQQNLQFYSKDENEKPFENHAALKFSLEQKNKQLIFAMNGGMYKKDLSPQGLYIENGVIKAMLDTLQEGYGNFYLQPNGVFYISKDNKGFIARTTDFTNSESIKYATQSGPMLVIEGRIHPKFNQDSENLHIRNGVGILPNGNLLFAMSKEKVNFYHFARFFQEQGCQNALYLDGFVSRTYLPSKDWVQEDGRYGIIIAEINRDH
ncbi:MAG: phosphodiester glycosidase family protein [Bacteroidota bacterium]